MRRFSRTIVRVLLFVAFSLFLGPIIIKFISENMKTELRSQAHVNDDRVFHQAERPAKDLLKKDWHDDVLIEKDSQRTG